MFKKKKKGGRNSFFSTSKVTITFFVPIGVMARNNEEKKVKISDYNHSEVLHKSVTSFS